ncbi:hypothetical protein IT570_03985 [Candidatus Sumerlaeota bacterium]|nr:hypothetical protein [Candidatus Sumerlaeota bacterium]
MIQSRELVLGLVASLPRLNAFNANLPLPILFLFLGFVAASLAIISRRPPLALGIGWAIALIGCSLCPPGMLSVLILVAVTFCIHASLGWLRGSGLSGIRWPRRSQPPRTSTRVACALLLLLSGLAFIQLVRFAGIPLVNYDVLSYHIPISAQYLSGGFGRPLDPWSAPQTFYEYLPPVAFWIESRFINGTPYTCGPQLLIISCIVAGANCAASIAARLGGRQVARLLAVLLYLLHPIAVNNVMQGLIDPITALFAIASLDVMLRAVPARKLLFQALLFLLSGVLAGASFATKYSAAGIVVVPLLLAGIGYSFFNRRSPATLAMPLAYALGLSLFVVPLLWRAYALSGNLAFPFAGSTSKWSTGQARFVVNAHDPTSPLGAAYWHHAATRIGTLGLEIPRTGISVLLLAALSTLFSQSRRKTVIPLLVVALGYAAWLLVGQNPARFLFPSAAILIPIASVGATHAIRHRLVSRAVFGALLAVLLLGSWSMAGTAIRMNGAYTLRARKEALRDYLGGSFMKMVDDTRGFSTVFFFEARSALFGLSPGRRIESGSVWDLPPYATELHQAKDAAEFSRYLRSRGEYVFVNEFEWGRLLDFYSKRRLPSGARHQGMIGMWSQAPAIGSRIDWLAAYPPHQFAHFDERELKILERFLLVCRSKASNVMKAGPGAEIWYAKIPEESEFQ